MATFLPNPIIFNKINRFKIQKKAKIRLLFLPLPT